MDRNILQKAKEIECDINEYEEIIRSKDAPYNYMLINISAANINDGIEYYGKLDKKIWEKMLNVLEEELKEKYKQFKEL